jgi:hypothetical protein
MSELRVSASQGIVTIRVGRMIEHIDGRGKTADELYDAIKWAAISKGVSKDHVELRRIRIWLKAKERR